MQAPPDPHCELQHSPVQVSLCTKVKARQEGSHWDTERERGKKKRNKKRKETEIRGQGVGGHGLRQSTAKRGRWHDDEELRREQYVGLNPNTGLKLIQTFFFEDSWLFFKIFFFFSYFPSSPSFLYQCLLSHFISFLQILTPTLLLLTQQLPQQ